MINAVRSELLKMRTMPGVWVCFGLAFPLTVLFMTAVFAGAGGFPGHTFYFVHTLNQERILLGAGYLGITFLAPITGVICITSEYRQKTITNTLISTPVRSRVLGAKVLVTSYWAILMAVPHPGRRAGRRTALELRSGWHHLVGHRPGRRRHPRSRGGLHPVGPLRVGLRRPGQEPGGRHPHHHRHDLHPRGRSSSRLAPAIFHYNLNWLPSSAACRTGRRRGDGGDSVAGTATRRISWRGGRAAW